jgi:hypothetical protein
VLLPNGTGKSLLKGAPPGLPQGEERRSPSPGGVGGGLIHMRCAVIHSNSQVIQRFYAQAVLIRFKAFRGKGLGAINSVEKYALNLLCEFVGKCVIL